MGAWGLGPFDSDSALDFLDSLARQVARQDENYDIVPGSVNHFKAVSALRRAMGGLPAGEHDVSDDVYAADEAYTACGLVAAVLTGHSGQSAGTSLRRAPLSGGGVNLNLDSHCGHAVLLTEQDAVDLIPAARAAAAALGRNDQWLASFGTEAMTEHVRALQQVLEQADRA